MPFKRENTPDKQALRGLFRQLTEEDMAPDVISDEDATVEDQLPLLIVGEDDSLPSAYLDTERQDPLSMPEGEDFPLFFGGEEVRVAYVSEDTGEVEMVPSAPTVCHPPLRTLWKALKRRLPKKGDSKKNALRKWALLMAVVVAVGCVGFLVYDTAVNPAINYGMYRKLATQYRQSGSVVLEGIGPQARGWLTYRSASEQDFLGIDYPVVQGEDNDSYRTRDVYGWPNRNGALYFHKDNHLEEDNYNNKVLVIYGNNNVTGQMFSSLNTLVGPVNYARKATVINLNTLYEENQYKVFAVIVTDDGAADKHYFDPCRLNFTTNGAFMDFVEQLQGRSLFDYPVDVIPGDQLLMLSTELSASVSGLEQGRLTVVARKVRNGEGEQVAEAEIVKNDDVVLPYAMYQNKGRKPHAYYESGEMPQNTTTAVETTITATTTTWYTDATDATTMDEELLAGTTDDMVTDPTETTELAEGESTTGTDVAQGETSSTETTETQVQSESDVTDAIVADTTTVGDTTAMTTAAEDTTTTAVNG